MFGYFQYYGVLPKFELQLGGEIRLHPPLGVMKCRCWCVGVCEHLGWRGHEGSDLSTYKINAINALLYLQYRVISIFQFSKR